MRGQREEIVITAAVLGLGEALQLIGRGQQPLPTAFA
jgi:hypothetical protein